MFPSFTVVDEISPLYSATRYIEFGNFFQRLESIFLLIWILAFACYISIVLKFSMNLFRKITNIETKKPLINIFGLLMFGITMLPKNIAISENFEVNIYPHLVLIIVFILGISILVLANIKVGNYKFLKNTSKL